MVTTTPKPSVRINFAELAAADRVVVPDSSNPIYGGAVDQNGQLDTEAAIELSLTQVLQAKQQLTSLASQIEELENSLGNAGQYRHFGDVTSENEMLGLKAALIALGQAPPRPGDTVERVDLGGQEWRVIAQDSSLINSWKPTSLTSIPVSGDPTKIQWTNDIAAPFSQAEKANVVFLPRISKLVNQSDAEKMADPDNPIAKAIAVKVNPTTVNGMASVNTIAALSSYNPGTQNVVAVGDARAAGIFNRVSGTANNYTTFNVSGVSGQVWSRNFTNGIYDAEWSAALAGADDLAKVQTMINDLPPGSKLRLKANKTYTTAVGLRLTKPIILDMNGATINLTGLTGKKAIDISSNDVTVENGSLTGPGSQTFVGNHGAIHAESTGERNTANSSTTVYYIERLLFNNISIYGFSSTGISLECAKDFRISNCKIKRISYSAVELMSCRDGLVETTTVDDVFSTNFNSRTSNGRLAYGMSANCVAVLNRPVSDNIIFRDNLIMNIPTWEGFDTHAGINLKYIGNTIINCKNAFSITEDSQGRQVQNILVHNNIVITDKSIQYAHGLAVYFPRAETHGGGATGVTITGNTFIGSGIHFRGSNGIVIEGNSFLRCLEYGITDKGNNKHFTIRNNYFEDIYGLADGTISGSVTDPNAVVNGPWVWTVWEDDGVDRKEWRNWGTGGNCYGIIAGASGSNGIIEGNTMYTDNKSINALRNVVASSNANALYKYVVGGTASTGYKIASINKVGIYTTNSPNVYLRNNNMDAAVTPYQNIGTGIESSGTVIPTNGIPTFNSHPNGSTYRHLTPGNGPVFYVKQNGNWIAK